MFTTGSKFLFGGTVLALVGTLIYAATADASTLGVIGLVSVIAALALIAGINQWVRDSTVSSMDTPGIARSAAAASVPANSMWPAIGALGLATIALGLVVGMALVWLGVIILLCTLFEWMIQAWSEGASSDPAYNASIRKRLLNPIEFPALSAVGLGAVIFSFSRIVLHLPKTGGLVVFGGVAAIVLLFGSLIASRHTVGRSLVTALCAVGGVGILGAGVASALAGSREIIHHEVASAEEGTCSAEESEADEEASQAIAAKSNLAATLVLEDGKLYATQVGMSGRLSVITLQRSNPSNIEFKNKDAERRRLLANLGVEVKDAGTATESKIPTEFCTQLAREDGVQFLTFTAPRASQGAEEPYSFTVPGVDGTSVQIVVP